MSKLSLDTFVSLLERSKLLEPERLNQVVEDWKRQATLAELDDAQPLADHLVHTGLITHWQSHKLLDGRHRGFYLGKYKLLDHLGSGGMSNVYLAQHVLMQRQVAIKVLPHNRVSDSSYLAQFHVEAQAAAALDHKNIVRAYDLDSEGRIHYFVMEYIEGQDLHALVERQGPLDFATAANFVAQAAAGLAHAHSRGLVHRDIKPANLLVDRSGTVKVLDMGLAKFTCPVRASGSPLNAEHVLGTADYLAPEQAVNSQSVDHRADIYSLGCTFYYLLAGQPPFAEGTSLDRMTAHRQLQPKSLTELRHETPDALVAICQRMMAKSPAERFQSADEVRNALRGWLEREAASGRVDLRALAAVASAAESPVRKPPASSRLNLISGSAADLPPPAPDESAPFTGTFQDTDLNLVRATVKIPQRPATTPSPLTESHVLRHGEPGSPGPAASGSASGRLVAPPVVAPPVDDSFVLAAPRVESLAPGQVERSIVEPRPSRSALLRQRLAAREEASSRFWIVLIGTMLLTAAMLLLATSWR